MDHLKKTEKFTLTRTIHSFIYPQFSSCLLGKKIFPFFLTKTSDFAANVNVMTP